jgi:hypothetical protein
VEAVIPVDDGLFRTAEGDAVTAVTAEEMRTVDRVAVEAFGVDLFQMMEHAGRNLALAARERRAAGPVVLADIAVPAGVYDRLDIPYGSPFDRRYRVPLRPADGRPDDP